MITQNDCLRMVRAACWSFSTRKLTRDIFYGNYGNFNVHQFLISLETNLLQENQCCDCISYDKLTKVFKDVTKRHAPLKKQKACKSQNPFIPKWLSKQIIKAVNINVHSYLG